MVRATGDFSGEDNAIHTLTDAGLALATSAASAADSTAAVNPPDGWYVGGGAGMAFGSQRFMFLNNAAPLPIVSQNVKIKFRDGFAAMLYGGYKFPDTIFRTELEFSYASQNAKDVGGSVNPWTGSQRDPSIMGNLLFDIPTGTNWTPYIGGGIGLSFLSFKDVKGQTPPIYNGSNTKMAFQGIVGVAVTVSPQTQVTLDFRYKGSNNNAFNSQLPPNLIRDYDARSNRVMLGIRYALGQPAQKAAPTRTAAAAPPPPPPPPAAAARPAPPPVEQKFLVFFDFDKSNLRNDSKNIVQQAADYAKKNGKVRLTTTGHTDTSGSDAYNQALSERRAKEVQKELNRLGIPNNEIVVLWKGESMPLVQTGDGVKEPQNRRVEIVLE